MMGPMEREEFWNQTVHAARAWDPRLLKALIAALVMRHGALKTCENGCCTYPLENITIEELYNITARYNLGLRAPEYGKLELSVIDRSMTGDSDHGDAVRT